jgi:hypothetical protein
MSASSSIRKSMYSFEDGRGPLATASSFCEVVQGFELRTMGAPVLLNCCTRCLAGCWIRLRFVMLPSALRFQRRRCNVLQLNNISSLISSLPSRSGSIGGALRGCFAPGVPTVLECVDVIAEPAPRPLIPCGSLLSSSGPMASCRFLNYTGNMCRTNHTWSGPLRRCVLCGPPPVCTFCCKAPGRATGST